MSSFVCTYVVARFVPDPVRDEARNFGIVLQCIDRGFLGTKFESNLRKRFGGVTDNANTKIVRAYVEQVEKDLRLFHGPAAGLPKLTEPLHPDFLRHLWQAYTGKVQFSEPRGCVAEDPQAELGELFELLVTERSPRLPKVEKRSSIAREVGKYFRQSQLIGKAKLQVNYPVLVRGQEIPVDFGYKHPTRDREVLIETVDLTHDSLRDRIEALSPTAVKFEMLKDAKKEAVKTVSIVKTHPYGIGNKYALELKELKRHADQVVDLSRAEALKGVITMVRRDFGTTSREAHLYN